MARPTTKEDLIKAGNEQFTKMWKVVDSLTDEAQRGIFDFDGKEAHWKRDKNIRDIFIHLYEWHQLFLNWVSANQKGKMKPFLREPYNWKTYGDMNVEFWKEHQNTFYEDSIAMLKESHQKVIDSISQFSNEELFSKGVFSWTGGSTLGSYGVSATASHYDWAIKKLSRYKKELGQ